MTDLETIEDIFLHCESCSGECDLFVNADGRLICIQCANGKRVCA